MTESVTLDFDAIFQAFIDANQKKWGHDRSQTLGASEVFDCLRKGFFGKRGKELGYEPDEDYVEDWGAMTRGNLIENYHVAPAVRDHMPDGINVLYTGDDQVTLQLGRSSATPDGLITGLPKGCRLNVKGGTQDIVIDDIISDCVCLEIKSIDPRATLLEERNKHHGQTQVQLGLFHDKTEFRPHYSIILYIDASFLSRVTPFVVKFDPELHAIAKTRASQVWESNDPEDFVPEGRLTGGCEHCKWTKACGTASVRGIPTYDDDDVPEEVVEKLDTAVARLFQAQKDKTDAELEEKRAKEVVKDILAAANRRKAKGETWSVTWFGNGGRKSIDTKAMAADGIDLSKYEKEGAEFDTLRVTPRLKETKPKTRKNK